MANVRKKETEWALSVAKKKIFKGHVTVYVRYSYMQLFEYNLFKDLMHSKVLIKKTFKFLNED